MHSEFAYSSAMQMILVLLTYTNSFIHMYLNSNLILKFYGEQTGKKPKIIFTLLTGPVLHITFVYIMDIIGGAADFTRIQYALFTSVNPITALAFCFLGIKILGLSRDRSIELMGHCFMYSAINHSMFTLLSAIVFVQDDPTRYNYLNDGIRLIISIAILFSMYRLTLWMLSRHSGVPISQASVIPKPKQDLAIYICKACFCYLCMVGIPLAVPNFLVASLLAFIMLLLVFALAIYQSLYRHGKAEIANKEAHIHSLISSSVAFRSLKHDFYNVLQTYSGYLDMGDIDACKRYHQSLLDVTVSTGSILDLSERFAEHPVLMSLIAEKHNRAERYSVQMSVSLTCPLSELPINDIDLCRILSCLIDNAIEAAATSDRRHVAFSAEDKPDGAKLLIVTNSCQCPLDMNRIFMAGISSKEGHQGLGLYNVKRIIDRNRNCSFQMKCYNNEMIAYVEFKNKRS